MVVTDFSAALRKLLEKDVNYLIRGYWLNHADFANRIINLSQIDQYIVYSPSYCAGRAKCLRHYQRNKDDNCFIGTDDIKLTSEDLLSEDWINLTGWTVVENNDEYQKLIKKLNSEKEGNLNEK